MDCQSVKIYPVGERGVTLQCVGDISLENQRKIWWIAEQIDGDTIFDVIPGMNNITVVFDPLRETEERYIDLLTTLWESTKTMDFTVSTAGKTIEIPVTYGGEYGPDLTEVAAYHNLSVDEVVSLHTEALYTVFFIGFMPGFVYLGGMNPQLITPRRSTPRESILKGSVGIGGHQTGIYPAQSPGGWQIIGNTSIELFDPHRNPPSLFKSGDHLKFTVQKVIYD